MLGAQPNISSKDIESLFIPFPVIEQKLLHFLSAIDVQIEGVSKKIEQTKMFKKRVVAANVCVKYKSMSKTFNIYCDESCHLENDHKKYMFLGSTSVAYNQVKLHTDYINNLEEKTSFLCGN